MKNQLHNLVCLAVCAASILFTNTAKAVTVYTSRVPSGNWNSASSWTQTGSGSDVKYVIQSGHSITLNTNASGIDSVTVSGTLSFGSGNTLTIDSFGKIIVLSGGTISGGNGSSKIIFAMATSQITGPFNGGNTINNGPRFADYLTTTAASGNPSGSFISFILPVELSSIEVVKNGADFQLQWTALGESNKSDFQVEISTNGIDYFNAGTVSGNEEVNASDYSFNIIGVKGNFYVRLSETDQNGNSKALATKYVKNNTTQVDAFQIYPTLLAPAGENINMVLPNHGEYKVAVYNMNMQVAAESTASTYSKNEVVAINSNNWNLKTGQYIVVVAGNNGDMFKTRIIVR
ncbi:MAG: T9SS type A sorting domain-containing protein [Bacteroidetes bacterium]|nr:T9SS type A sorting domain-containing protein [Bacteroidota bacterium]